MRGKKETAVAICRCYNDASSTVYISVYATTCIARRGVSRNMTQGREVVGSRPLPFPQKQVPLLQLGGLGSAVSSPSGVWGGAPAEIEFGTFQPLKMTSDGNNFNDFPESAYYTTNRQSALGLMFAEFRGGRRFGPLNTPLVRRK